MEEEKKEKKWKNRTYITDKEEEVKSKCWNEEEEKLEGEGRRGEVSGRRWWGEGGERGIKIEGVVRK